MPSSVMWMREVHECRHILQVDLTHLPGLMELCTGCVAAAMDLPSRVIGSDT